MPVAAEIVQALQMFVTRRINTFDPVVITITKIRAGTTNNVIPETVAPARHAARGVASAAAGARSTAIERVVDGDRRARTSMHARSCTSSPAIR